MGTARSIKVRLGPVSPDQKVCGNSTVKPDQAVSRYKAELKGRHNRTYSVSRDRKRKSKAFQGRARFMVGCKICENLSEDYNCIMPYHEWHRECKIRTSHCTCKKCWPE